MKLKNLILTGSLCAAFSLAGIQTVSAQEGHKSDQAEMKVPDTADGILAEIHMHHEKLTATVKAKELADVHEHAFAIRDLAKALDAKAPADKKARVQGTVNNISKLAEDLDTSGDAGDQAKTEANLKKFDAMLAQLQGQFK